MFGDYAISVACEHCRWARSDGQSPFQIVAALRENRLVGRLRAGAMVTWDDAVGEVAKAYQELPQLHI